MWGVENSVGFRELCRFDSDITALGVSPDGGRVFVASLDMTAKLIDFETGNVIAEIGNKPKPFLSVAFTPDGQAFAVGDADGALQIRQTADAKLLGTLTGSAGHLTALTYSPDGLRFGFGKRRRCHSSLGHKDRGSGVGNSHWRALYKYSCLHTRR
jgi:WD40 repeat protein